MFRPIPFQAFLLSVCLLTTQASFADAKKIRTVRILFLERPASAPKTLFLHDGQNSREVELPKMNFSPVYNLAHGQITLTMLPEAVADPLLIPKAAPTLLIPETMSHFYLIVTSDPENPITPIRMKSIDAGSEKLRNGETLWFNLTEHTIAGQLGSQSLRLNSKARAIMKPPINEAGNYDVHIAYRTAGDPKMYPICKTVWTHNPQSRDVAFIFQKPNSRTPRIHSFRDSRD